MLVSHVEPMHRGHQERLAPLVAKAMAEAELSFDQLERVAVTIGPGSFTGLRVGLAFAKGLGQALAIPVIGVGTLEAIAAPFADRPGVIFAVLTAKPGHVFAQAFEGGQPVSIPNDLTLDAAGALLDQLSESGPITLVGTSLDHFPRVGAGRYLVEQADPVIIARLAERQSILPPQPLYLRAPDAKLPGGRDLPP